MSVLILLNGAMSSGKSKAVERLKSLLPMVDRQCKEKLHSLVMDFFNVPEDVYWRHYNERILKENPSSLYQISEAACLRLQKAKGLTDKVLLSNLDSNDMVHISPRDALIFVSECVIKPNFGKEFFGAYRVNTMSDDELAIDDSAGFVEELYPAIKKLGQENILLIRIQGRGGEGSDSRVLIPAGVINNTVDIDNGPDVSLDEYLDKIERVVFDFLENKALPDIHDDNDMTPENVAGMR